MSVEKLMGYSLNGMALPKDCSVDTVQIYTRLAAYEEALAQTDDTTMSPEEIKAELEKDAPENKARTCKGCIGKEKHPRNRSYWGCQTCTRNLNIKDQYEAVIRRRESDGRTD